MRSDAVGWPSCSISCFIFFSLFGFSFIHSLLLSALSPFCHCADFSVAFLSYLVHTRFLPFLFVLMRFLRLHSWTSFFTWRFCVDRARKASVITLVWYRSAVGACL
ncbi:hypothetical protein C8J56DRAFT_966269, partial [Mycena floridula]